MRKLFISFSAFLFCQQCLTLDMGPIVQLSYQGDNEIPSDNIIQYVLHNPNSIETFVLDKRNSYLGANVKQTDINVSSASVLNTTQRETIPFLRFEELIDSLAKQNIGTHIRNMREFFEPVKYPINESESSLYEENESEKKGFKRIIQNTFPGFSMNFSSYECTHEQNKTENLDIIKKVCLSVKPENVNRFIYVKYPTSAETSRKVFEILSNFPRDLSIQDIQDAGCNQCTMEESRNNDADTVIIGTLPDNTNEKVEQGIEHVIKNHILKEAIDTYFIEPEAIKKEIYHGAIRKHKKRAVVNMDKMNDPSIILPLNKITKGPIDKKMKIQVINNLSDNDSVNTSFLSKGAALEYDEEDTDDEDEDEETNEETEEEEEEQDDDDDDDDDDDTDDDDDDDTEDVDEDEDEDEDEDNDNISAKESLKDMAHDLLDASTGKGSLSIKQVKVLKDLTDEVKKHNTIDDIKKHASESNEETENKINEYQAYQKKTIQKIHESKQSIYDMINTDLNTLLKPAQKEYLKVAESLKQKLLKQYNDMLNEVKEDE